MHARNRWTNSEWEEVDFFTFGNNFQCLFPSCQVLHTKIVHDQLPLRRRRCIQSSVQTEALRLCPCCKQQIETKEHFLRCGSNPAHAARVSALSEVISKDLDHPVRRVTLTGVKHWFSHSDEVFTPDIRGYPSHMTHLIESAIASQSGIGWYQAIKGFFSTKWRVLAEMDMYDKKLNNSAYKG
jgi:hypothetical protein